MRLLLVSPRYGAGVSGGAEHVVRELGRRLHARGHEVHVLTSCARSYTTWDDVFPPGDTDDAGVQVHRFRVDRTPLPETWPSGSPVRTYRHTAPWQLAGYPLAGSPAWLQRRSPEFDVVIAYTYLHHTTWDTVMLSRVPVLLHPAAHPEPTLNAAILDLLFRRASMVSLHTPEEVDLIRWRFGLDTSRLSLMGMGVAPPHTTDEEIARFRSSSGIGDHPYAVCVGRTDPGKGTPELHRQFLAFKARHPGPLRLVIVGEETQPLPSHPEVVCTGFVPEATRNAAVAGADVLIQPSLYESFSLVLAEAWLLGVPALVQARSAVLRGQVARSGGGLAYHDDSDLEEALQRLLGDAALRRRLAGAGKAYATRHFDWGRFLQRYERLLERVALRGPRGAAAQAGLLRGVPARAWARGV